MCKRSTTDSVVLQSCVHVGSRVHTSILRALQGEKLLSSAATTEKEGSSRNKMSKRRSRGYKTDIRVQIFCLGRRFRQVNLLGMMKKATSVIEMTNFYDTRGLFWSLRPKNTINFVAQSVKKVNLYGEMGCTNLGEFFTTLSWFVLYRNSPAERVCFQTVWLAWFYQEQTRERGQ